MRNIQAKDNKFTTKARKYAFSQGERRNHEKCRFVTFRCMKNLRVLKGTDTFSFVLSLPGWSFRRPTVSHSRKGISTLRGPPEDFHKAKLLPRFLGSYLSGRGYESQDQCEEGPLKNSFERPSWTFWGTHPGEANGPHVQWANRKLFDPPEAESSCDLVSKPVDGSKSSCKQVKKGFSRVSMGSEPWTELYTILFFLI